MKNSPSFVVLVCLKLGLLVLGVSLEFFGHLSPQMGTLLATALGAFGLTNAAQLVGAGLTSQQGAANPALLQSLGALLSQLGVSAAPPALAPAPAPAAPSPVAAAAKAAVMALALVLGARVLTACGASPMQDITAIAAGVNFGDCVVNVYTRESAAGTPDGQIALDAVTQCGGDLASVGQVLGSSAKYADARKAAGR